MTGTYFPIHYVVKKETGKYFSYLFYSHKGYLTTKLGNFTTGAYFPIHSTSTFKMVTL
jgi:hypothetical protein